MEYGNYFKDAFQKLNLLEQDFDISVDAGKTDELAAFIADDREAVPEEPVFDVSAEKEDELQDSYVGKVIIECECCHSKFYKEPEDVIIDEETQLANIDEECPFCNAAMGYTVIGKIEPFDEAEPTEDEVEVGEDDVVEVEEPEEEVEETEEEEEVHESLQNRIRRTHLLRESANDEFEIEPTGETAPDGEPIFEITDDAEPAVVDDEEHVEESVDDLKKLDSFLNIKEESLTEGIDNLSLDTDDTHLEMQADENGKVTVTTEPKVEEELTVEDEFPVDDVATDTEEFGAEEIAPLDQEEVDAIEANSEEEAAEEQPEEEIPAEEEAPAEEEEGEEEEFDEFDEESFDQMGESYLRRVYDNVKSYKTTNVSEHNNTLIIEGLITFDSGNTKSTTFTFTNPKSLKGDRIVLEGYNKTFTKTKKAFSLKGKIDEKKFITESLGYHYITKYLNESVRVTGRVKRVLV